MSDSFSDIADRDREDPNWSNRLRETTKQRVIPKSPLPEPKPTQEHLEALRGQYRQQAALAAEASADIALYEEKIATAKQLYEAAKNRRDDLKRQIAKHPLS